MMRQRPKKFWESPYEYEGKIIHVGTPGIFHRLNPVTLRETYCGRSTADARATDHKLRQSHSPCVVCFAATAPGSVVELRREHG